MTMRRILTIASLAGFAFACNNAPKDTRPAGPAAIQAPEVAYATDLPTIKKGEEVFTAHGCPACHKIGGGKLVGPDLQNVTARRNPLWIAKMILHPEQMVSQDETARQLLATHMTPMPNQKVDAATELPALMSFLKTKEVGTP
jgi:cytochrome c551/c552